MASEQAGVPAALRECGTANWGLVPKFTTIERGGVTIRMATQGNPRHQAIVLLHGFPDYWCGWGEVIPALSRDYFVIAPDLRGYNKSSKPGTADPGDVAPYLLTELVGDVAAIVGYATDVTWRSGKKPALVAHDWGAIVAWQYARVQGTLVADKIDALVAISVPHPIATTLVLGTPAANVLAVANASTRPLDFGALGTLTLGQWITAKSGTGTDAEKLAFIQGQQQAQGAALAYTQQLVATNAYDVFSANGYTPLFDKLSTTFFHDPSAFFTPFERAAYVRSYERTGGAGMQKSFQAAVKYYRANLIAPLPYSFAVAGVPVLYVAPRYDGAINYPWGVLGLDSVVPDLRVETVETGHFVQRESPQALVALIELFLRR